MNVWLIWAKAGSGTAGTSGNEVWLIDAWDQDSIEGNNDGWMAAKKNAYVAHGEENILISRTQVNLDAVLDRFNAPLEV